MADQTGTKGIRVSRRKLLLGAGVGVVLGANVLIIRARNAQNKPRSIDLGFQGPFSYEQELPVDNRKDAPVTIRRIDFPEKDVGSYLLIDFSFNGEKDATRKVVLTVIARDSAGRVLVEDRVVCHDARLRTLNLHGGSEPDWPGPNAHNVNLGGITPQEIAQLEITFRDLYGDSSMVRPS